MTLLEVIGDVRRTFKNDKIISIKEYKELLYIIESDKFSRVKKSLITYNYGHTYYTYNLIIEKLASGIHLFFKDDYKKIEKGYVINSNNIQ